MVKGRHKLIRNFWLEGPLVWSTQLSGTNRSPPLTTEGHLRWHQDYILRYRLLYKARKIIVHSFFQAHLDAFCFAFLCSFSDKFSLYSPKVTRKPVSFPRSVLNSWTNQSKYFNLEMWKMPDAKITNTRSTVCSRAKQWSFGWWLSPRVLEMP